jgi:hypothetical protein
MSVAIIRAKTCTNCGAGVRQGDVIECRLNPPTVFPIIISTPQGPRSIGKVTEFPIVKPDWHCRQHTPKIEIALGDMQTDGVRAS